MNCTEANKMSIAGFLLSKGFNPTDHNESSFLYFSPFRNEKTPSFKVDRFKNVWYDFGTGTGGRLIDLVCQMYRVGISGALLILSGVGNTVSSFSFHQPDKPVSNEKTFEIRKVQPLQNRTLIQYIESRGIPFHIARRYTTEVYYNAFKGQVKSFFAIGFENDKGGYELRSNFATEKFPNGFKGSSSPKAITTISGNPRKINVFEGFIDFLSALVFYGIQEPGNTTIVLNSLSHLRHLYDILPNFERINLYLDNDPAGQRAAAEIINRFPGAINQAKQIYPENKDFNELIYKTNQL